MMRKRMIDSETLQELKRMYENGMTQREIAQKMGVCQRTISNWLNGYAPYQRGGRVASTIPKEDFEALDKAKRAEVEYIAAKNAENACLVVANKEISLEGTVAKYTVFSKDKAVVIDIGGDMIEVKFDFITDFISELKAIARNMGGLDAGCEMW